VEASPSAAAISRAVGLPAGSMDKHRNTSAATFSETPAGGSGVGTLRPAPTS
jgi:hypothetical protein